MLLHDFRWFASYCFSLWVVTPGEQKFVSEEIEEWAGPALADAGSLAVHRPGLINDGGEWGEGRPIRQNPA